MSTPSTLNLVLPTEYTEEQHLDVEQKIFTILDVYLQPSSEVTATTAAQEINNLFPKNPDSQQDTPNEEAYTFLLRLWNFLIVVVEQIPWQHPSQDKIIVLTKAIRDLPNPITIMLEHALSDQVKLWTDLPVLDEVLTDNVETHGIVLNDDSDDEKESRLRDINFQAFAARLTTEGVFDLSRLAVYRLRDLLEEDPDYCIPEFDKKGPHLDACILPAAVWISLAARVIFGFCKVNGDGADRNDICGGKHWKGSEGFSVDRWEWWKQRLEQIAVNEEASEETRSTVKKMLEVMVTTEAEAET